MLEPGARISYQLPEEEQRHTCTVRSCNRRGTSCVVELRPGETRVINLNRAEYTLLEGQAAAPSGSGDEAGRPDAADGAGARQASASEASGASDGDPASDGSDAEEEGASGSDAEAAEPALDAFDQNTSERLHAFLTALQQPGVLLQPSAEVAALARQAAKALYDHTAAAAGTPTAAGGALPQLHVEGLDAEQVWSQLEPATGAAVRQLRRRLRKLGPDTRLLNAQAEADLAELLGGGATADSSGSEPESDAVSGSDGGGAEAGAAFDGKLPPASEGESEGGSEAGEDEEAEGRSGSEGGGELLPTEDAFMRLGDMERFVQEAEAAAMAGNASDTEQGGDSEDSEGSDGEDEAGPFGTAAAAAAGEGELSSDEEQLERLLESAAALAGPGQRGGKGKQAKGLPAADSIMYEDFFGPGSTGGRRREEPSLDADGAASGSEASEGEEQAGSDGEAGGWGAGFGSRSGEREGELLPRAPERLSAHERRLARTAQRAARLEAENMGQKEWFMAGEAGAGARPLNSALEIDLDFERGLRPPPPPTEAATASLEDLIRRRIGERRWDDPAKAAPPPPQLQRELAALDDTRSAQGLGEVYAEEFVRAKAGGEAEDKDERKRKEARTILKELLGKLDALSHFHFAPKPVIEDLAVRSEVPALAMEEVAPQVVSEAARQLPGEVYAPPKRAAAKAEEELTHEERRRRRAAKKRGLKKRAEQAAEERKARGETQDGNVVIAGRKSAAADAADLAARKQAKLKRKRDKRAAAADDAPRVKFTKSSQVFAAIEASKGAKKKQRTGAGDGLKASAFKL